MRKYVIIGTGGTGGTIGAYLARAGMDVTFIARGEHLQAIKDKGLKIIRPKDEFIIFPCQASTIEDYNERADVVFVCVKGYSLEDVIPHIQRISDRNTVIIPILNIYGTGSAMQKYFNDSLVTDGCIYVAAQILKPGCIKMNGDIMRVVFGVRDETDYRDELVQIADDLNKSGITGILSDNIARDALLKYSYISAHGACGLYYNVPAGDIQRPGEIRDCFAGLVHEIDKLALAMSIHFEEDIVKRNLGILDDLSESAKVSIQRDIESGNRSEIEGLIYEVVKLGEKYKVDLPIYKKITGVLKERGLG